MTDKAEDKTLALLAYLETIKSTISEEAYLAMKKALTK